jgi:hypothetical protein
MGSTSYTFHWRLDSDLYERNLKILLTGILPPLFNGDGRGELTRKKKKPTKEMNPQQAVNRVGESLLG